MIRQIWILIAKRLSGEASVSEIRELQELSDDFGRQPLDVLDKIWKNTTLTDPKGSEQLDDRWLRLQKKLKENSLEQDIADIADLPAKKGILSGFQHSAILKYAAVILLTLAVGYLCWPSRQNEVVTTMVSPGNGISKMILPDGSSVFLNSGSKITYKNNNKTNCREVNLNGEAYFNVVKDNRHPFIVSTPTFTVKVLGTAFNVKSYSKSRQSEATLVHGKIELALLNRPETKYILKPSQKLTVNSASEPAEANEGKSGIIRKTKEDDYLTVELSTVHDSRSEGIPVEILWFKDDVNFDNASFGEVATMMEHRYNVKLKFKNEELADVKFSGRFKDETLDEALKELKAIIDFNYQIKKDQVLIY